MISSKKKDSKRLTINTMGSGTRKINMSYIVASPVWKTSYRLILDAKDNTTMLQGYAMVDNCTDEDWINVNLTLVAGLPISFTHDLYNPRYKQRPVIEINEEQAYAPPQLEATKEKKGIKKYKKRRRRVEEEDEAEDNEDDDEDEDEDVNFEDEEET
jgi:hypothetical protein